MPILYINSLVCLSRSSGPSQKADRARPGTLELPDFHRPSPSWGVSGRVRHRRPASRLSGPLHGWNGHGHSLLPSTGDAGTTILWSLARGGRGLCRNPTLAKCGVKPNIPKVGDLESSGTPECLEFDSKAQNTSH